MHRSKADNTNGAEVCTLQMTRIPSYVFASHFKRPGYATEDSRDGSIQMASPILKKIAVIEIA
jgi:hypothetical protein